MKGFLLALALVVLTGISVNMTNSPRYGIAAAGRAVYKIDQVTGEICRIIWPGNLTPKPKVECLHPKE